jgi:gamma-glutamylcyclotransferase
MTEFHYFAYGSNMDERHMREHCPQARVEGPGRLDGFRLEFNVYSDRWDGGAANLEPDPGAHVWGVVWAVDAEDLDALDTYTGHPTFYRRDEVQVGVGEEAVPCLTYRVAHQKGFVRPTDAYLNQLRAGMRMQGLPPEALDMLDATARPPRPHIST